MDKICGNSRKMISDCNSWLRSRNDIRVQLEIKGQVLQRTRGFFLMCRVAHRI